MQCDNSIAVAEMNLARIRNIKSQAFMREINYWAAIYEIEVYTIHIAGFCNKLANALSKWHLDDSYQKTFQNLIQGQYVKHITIANEVFQFTGE